MPSTLVSFSKGTKANLNPSTIGGLYLTTDTGELFLHNAAEEDIKISDIETVAEESDLPTVGTEIATKFYYVEETNGLYRVIDNEWTKLGGDPVSAGTGLTYAADGITLKAKIKSETGIGASESAAATATSGRFYPVQVDSSGNLAVNVPWTDTQPPVTSVNGSTGAVVLGAADVSAIPTTAKGANSGVAELDSSGKVPSSQLPSYVDDVIEVTDYASLPTTGETGKIYVTLDDNKTYRWSGSAYVVVGSSLALGETSSTAYRGDHGLTAYNHSQNTGATTTYSSGLYKVEVNSMGHVTSATSVQKSDITALDIPGSDTTYTAGSGLDIPTGTTTINHSNSVSGGAGSTSSSSGQLSNGGTLNLPKVNYDAQGHITSVETTSCTLPDISSGVTSISAGTGLVTDQTAGAAITGTGTLSLDTCGTGAGTSGSTSAQTPTFGDTFDVPYVTTDIYGRVSARGTATVTIPNATATTTTAGLLSAADKQVINDISVLSGMTNDPTSESQALASTAYLCNYLSAEKMVINIAATDWSSTTVTVSGTAYYYYELPVSVILVSHPIIFLATDDVPTATQETEWGYIKMVADTANTKLIFYAATKPTGTLPIGIKGVVPAPAAE